MRRQRADGLSTEVGCKKTTTVSADVSSDTVDSGLLDHTDENPLRFPRHMDDPRRKGDLRHKDDPRHKGDLRRKGDPCHKDDPCYRISSTIKMILVIRVNLPYSLIVVSRKIEYRYQSSQIV